MINAIFLTLGILSLFLIIPIILLIGEIKDDNQFIKFYNNILQNSKDKLTDNLKKDFEFYISYHKDIKKTKKLIIFIMACLFVVMPLVIYISNKYFL